MAVRKRPWWHRGFRYYRAVKQYYDGRTFRRINEIFRELHEQLIEEVKSLKLSPADQMKCDTLLRAAESDKRIEASKVYKLEMFVLDRMDMVQLRIRIVSFREILQGLLTKEAWAMTEAELGRGKKVGSKAGKGGGSNGKQGSKQAIDVVRSHAKALATRIYRRYVLVPAVEKRRTAIVIKLVLLLVAAWLAACLVHCVWHGDLWRVGIPPLQLVAVLSGATGATVSVIRRFYRIDPLHEPLLTWLSIERGALSIYISPLIGAVFGLVLLAVAQAELLTGALMPDLGCALSPDSAVVGESGKEPVCKPLNEFAKVALLGFVAGWGERIVPDVLNKLENRTTLAGERP